MKLCCLKCSTISLQGSARKKLKIISSNWRKQWLFSTTVWELVICRSFPRGRCQLNLHVGAEHLLGLLLPYLPLNNDVGESWSSSSCLCPLLSSSTPILASSSSSLPRDPCRSCTLSTWSSSTACVVATSPYSRLLDVPKLVIISYVFIHHVLLHLFH